MYIFSGYGAGGRLGIGGTDSVCQPMLLESIQRPPNESHFSFLINFALHQPVNNKIVVLLSAMFLFSSKKRLCDL